MVKKNNKYLDQDYKGLLISGFICLAICVYVFLQFIGPWKFIHFSFMHFMFIVPIGFIAGGLVVRTRIHMTIQKGNLMHGSVVEVRRLPGRHPYHMMEVVCSDGIYRVYDGQYSPIYKVGDTAEFYFWDDYAVLPGNIDGRRNA